MEITLLLILVFPLLGAAINGAMVRRTGTSASVYIASGAVLLSFIASVFLYVLADGYKYPVQLLLFEWIRYENISIPFQLYMDPLSALFVFIITGIGFLIHWYSKAYMQGDEGINRFFIYLNLFIFFMLILVLASNYLLMFVGWEGVGLCSYLLIGFWYKNTDYSKAANKAFIMNRIGDLGFLLGLMLMVSNFGSLNFSAVFPQISTIGNETLLTSIALLLFVGAIGKSAQLPLFTWLPDAMAGPTPVSALIHAATMVTAGIYLIARSSAIYLLAPLAMEIILYTGLATALIAAIIAVYQYDIKKVLAYSTVSQLGLMFAALGAGGFNSAVFHVLTHAAFKALLFLGAGSIIHGLDGEQDLRKMGGLKNSMPLTYLTFLIGTLAIAGIPPFAGFFSKDQILMTLFEKSGIVSFVIALGVSALTAFYMFRLFYLSFFGSARNNKHAHESPPAMTRPLVVLAVLSAVLGFIGIPALFTHSLGGHHVLDHYLSGSTHITTPHQPATLELMLMGVTLLIVGAAVYMAYLRYGKEVREDVLEVPVNAIGKTGYNKFYLDEIYQNIVTQNLNRFSAMLNKWVEEGIFSAALSLSGRSVREIGLMSRKLQTGNVGSYFFAMVVAMCIILLYFIIQ
jgi:NADH-quinone oxidoreductase subunit L